LVYTKGHNSGRNTALRGVLPPSCCKSEDYAIGDTLALTLLHVDRSALFRWR
jgi:hypothetical protein